MIILASCLCASVLFGSGCSTAYQKQVKPGKLHVIGTGPAGPEHATLKAIEHMKKADVLVCDQDMLERFGEYLKGKPVIADPWKGMFDYKGKSWRELSEEENKAFKKERIRIREEIVRKIKVHMAEGRNVALLDSGDPCTFGPSHWFTEGFSEDQAVIIPGMGAYEAASAALRKSNIPGYDTRFVMLSSPMFFMRSPDAEEMIRDLSRYPNTMVLYMGLQAMKELIPLLRKHHPGDLPVAVVYHAGYPGKEKVVKGSLDNILRLIKLEDERWMGMVFVGKNLRGSPYRSRLERGIPDESD